MLNKFKKAICTLTLAMGVISQVPAEELKVINVGIISTEGQMELSKSWEPMLKDYSKAIGMPVKAYFAPDYAGIIQAMRFKKVQIGYFGNKSAIEAVDRANAELFARYIDDKGSQGYYSYLLASSDNKEINNIQDVAAHKSELTLGNGDPHSTSGFLVPGFQAFAQNGIDTADFKQSLNSNHSSNFMAVAHHKVDIATNNSHNVAKMKESHPDLYKKVKVIWKSTLLPSDVLTYDKTLPEALKEKTRNFFVNYGTDGNKEAVAALAMLHFSGFAATDNTQLLPIRQMSVFKAMLSIKSDKALTEAEKAPKLAKLQKQLDDLAVQVEVAHKK